MKTALTFAIVFTTHLAYGQIDFAPYPGNTTHCPGEVKTGYTASGNNCGEFTWTITNGKILDSDNQEVTTLVAPSVDIRWDNIAGIGKLKVSSTCGGEVLFEEKNFAIRSLTGRVPTNAWASFTLPYCSTAGNVLMVDQMYLNTTGGFTNVS